MIYQVGDLILNEVDEIVWIDSDGTSRNHAVFSGNSPGIQRDARLAGKVRRSVERGRSGVVVVRVAGKPAGNAAIGPAIKQGGRCCMGHQTRDAAVAVAARVPPSPTRMQRGSGNDGIRSSESSIELLKALKESG